MYLRLSDLQNKKIININSGKSIGNIMDIEVLDTGKIESLIIEQSKNIFSLNSESEIRLYWTDKIKLKLLLLLLFLFF